MKFKDLQEGQRFIVPERYQTIIFKKVKKANKTCCSPSHNAIAISGTTKVLFAQEDNVSIYEEPNND